MVSAQGNRGLAGRCDLSDTHSSQEQELEFGASEDHAPNPLAGLPLLILGVAPFTPQ